MIVKVKSNIVSPIELGKRRMRSLIESKAMEWENECKMIISNADAVDTGEMLNSIRVEVGVNGFKGISSSKHMKYHEFGTIKHWVPFYSRSGEPILADWGRRVLKLTPEEMQKMGGIMVEIDELAPMRRALAKL